MSSGALASFYRSNEAVPVEHLYSLVQVVYAAGCVNFFLFVSSKLFCGLRLIGVNLAGLCVQRHFLCTTRICI